MNIDNSITESMRMLRDGTSAMPIREHYIKDADGIMFLVSVRTADRKDTHPKCLKMLAKLAAPAPPRERLLDSDYSDKAEE